MNPDTFLIQIPTSAVYMSLSIAAQLCLIVYCLGYSAGSKEKWSLIRFLVIWTHYNLWLCMGEIYFATYEIPRGVRHPDEVLMEQIWLTASVGLGPSMVAFFFQIMKRPEPLLIRTITVIAIGIAIGGWIYPEMADRNGSGPALATVPITILPLLYGIGWMCYYFFTTKDKRYKRRMSIILLSIVILMAAMISFNSLFSTEETKKIANQYRHLLILIMTLQQTFLYTLAITRYGIFDIGIENAADEMFKQMKDPALVISGTGRITRVNPIAQSIFQFPEAGIDRDITEWIPNFNASVSRFESKIALGRQESIYFCTLTPVQKGEERVGTVMVMRDITEEKRVMSMKNAFLSTVSHELRTPLTSILGFTKIIQKKWKKVIVPLFEADNKREERAKKQITKNVDVIISEGERLTALINNVLDITKMESGSIDWKYEKTTFLAIVEQSIAATQGLFDQKALTLTTELEDAEVVVVVDKDRLIQVLLNLLSNAVKFTERGTITIRVERQHQNIITSVIDSGVGMKATDVGKVFEKYQQVGKESGLQKGTGLGLPISKEIVEGHGGEIWAESELGKGSTFSFSIPLPQTQSPAVKKVNPEEVLVSLQMIAQNQVVRSTPEVLIVDDEPSIRQLVRQSLEPSGYRIREACDGLEALELIKQSLPDLMVSDVMMPRMNGFDLVAIIRNDVQRMHLPIVMLTVVPDEKRGYGLGVDSYLRKPIAPETIREEVSKVLVHRASERHVLLMGRDMERMQTLRDQIQALGYVIHTATSISQIDSIKGLRMSMVIVESGFLSSSELQVTLRSMGQMAPLIRLLDMG
ncbi:MAG: hybrid sensor histidine kinase/response regulator [Myxococcota bacterium]|nr:hybrid sensor histidine kinase/response regulator [Myxococcota bacterium]